MVVCMDVDLTLTLKQNMCLFKTYFFNEQKMLPSGEQYPCDVGKKQENIPRNRFKTTFPCEYIKTHLLFLEQQKICLEPL